MIFRIPSATSIQPKSAEVYFSNESLWTCVGKMVRESGLTGYEPETQAAAVACVQAYQIEQFIDVGANIGVYSLVLKSIYGDSLAVDAYEPLPMLNEMAGKLFAANKLDIRLRVEALSDSVGTANFYVSAVSDASNSLNSEFRKAKDVIEVALTTLDQVYSTTTGTKPKLLKVDTESTEPDVLSGGSALIKNQRPWIICEILHGFVEEKITALLKPLGYKFYHLNGEPLISNQPLVGDRNFKHRDWLLAPEAPSDDFNRFYSAWLQAFTSPQLDT